MLGAALLGEGEGHGDGEQDLKAICTAVQYIS